MELAADRVALVQAGLERLAEQRGDITQAVLDRYYAEQAGARESFVHHGEGDLHGLEARMVSESIYLLLRWVEEPAAVRIDQASTIVHHNDTLKVGPRWYMGLVDAVLAIVLETVPEEAKQERATWMAIRSEIAAFIDSLRPEFLFAIDPPGLGQNGG